MSTPGVDRQLKKFQNRVQQELILKDDEIERLEKDLAITNAEVLEAEDQLNKLRLQHLRRDAGKTGKQRRHRASLETLKANMISQHSENVQKLTREQASAISQIHSNFENEISKIEEYAEGIINKKCKQINSDISKTEEIYENIRKCLALSSGKENEELEEEMRQTYAFEANRVKRLENLLKERSKERLDSLLQVKSQLAECVGHLETLEKEHIIKMEGLRQSIKTIDLKYDDRLKRIREKHIRELEPLMRKHKELNQKVAYAMKNLEQTDHQHKQALTVINREADQLKVEYRNICSRENQIVELDDHVVTTNNNLNNLRMQLKEKEMLLHEYRVRNEILKREAARLKHEARVGKRRAQLNI